ncbi:MAG: hypothetical protein JNL11_07210 [Bdellovibrionaceae bacterium]|nr:hypothetical protein [Pseudobdellovibrionaceae bacterium]
MKIIVAVLVCGSLIWATEKVSDKTITLRRNQVKKTTTSDSVLISKIVGTAADQVITSREVQIVNMLEHGLLADKNLSLISSEDTRFNVEVGQVLLEVVVQAESNVFEFNQVTDDEFKAMMEKIQKNVVPTKEWKNLQVSTPELEKFLKRKLVAKKFIRVKSDSMKGFITDSEAKEYFDKNRLKFGQVPFVQFKENIKTFLSQQQLEERLKAWFEIIKKKYKVKNYTNETS